MLCFCSMTLVEHVLEVCERATRRFQRADALVHAAVSAAEDGGAPRAVRPDRRRRGGAQRRTLHGVGLAFSAQTN